MSGQATTSAALPLRLRIGTSGFNYPEWRERFYPAGMPVQAMLAYYAGRFETVEINYTFYRMPNARTIAGWVAETPESFVFALKAPRRITHEARLREIASPLAYFLEVTAGLGGRRGPLLFQLPPNFRQDLTRLGDLLAGVPAEVPLALEFRHPSWFTEEVYDRLRQRNAALCVADTEAGTTPLVATADWGYLRLRDADYPDATLRAWRERIAATGWREAFVYFKHEESGAGPALAERLIRLGLPEAAPVGEARLDTGAPPV